MVKERSTDPLCHKKTEARRLAQEEMSELALNVQIGQVSTRVQDPKTKV